MNLIKGFVCFFAFMQWTLIVQANNDFQTAAAAISAPTKKVALVYKGPGSCPEQCSESVAEVAKLAGLEPVFVGPNDDNPALFENAVVWMQPGGKSSKVAKTMKESLKDMIRQFIYNGGGYVGFCAGGFYATHIIGETTNIGLGIVPGATHLYEKVPDHAVMIDINWMGKTRNVYWEGGPYFILPEANKNEPQVQVMAYYPDLTPATVLTHYGRGTVVVTGAHPEAPAWWSVDEKIVDTDGVDHDLAVDMLRKAIAPVGSNY